MIKKIARPLKPIILTLDKYTGGKLFGYLGILSTQEKKVEYTPEEIKIKTDELIRQARLPIPSESELKMVEVIVLKYKDPEVETKCAQHVIENTQWPYRLNVYDNRLGTKNMSKIWNKLIRESTCDYVLIIDSDAFVPKLSPCWLTQMMGAFSNQDCYVVVPKVSKTSANEQRGAAENSPPRKLKFEFAAQCVLYKKEIFEKIGYFDEDFLFYGQDTEWSLRILKRGFPVYLVPSVSVEHLKHYSISKAIKNKEIEGKIEREYAERLLKEKM